MLCFRRTVPRWQDLKLGFGGEGPHPDTDTIHHDSPTKTIPLRPNQHMGINGVIWKTGGGMIHQEIYYDADASGRWQLGTQWDHPTCGYNRTSTAPASGAMFEFRIDCSNVTFSQTDLAVIQPGQRAAGGWDWEYIPMYDPMIGYYEMLVPPPY